MYMRRIQLISHFMSRIQLVISPYMMMIHLISHFMSRIQLVISPYMMMINLISHFISRIHLIISPLLDVDTFDLSFHKQETADHLTPTWRRLSFYVRK